ncbi:MAG: orotidine-5'-phosphate decarboxylase [Actinomycetota bacterium]
MIPRPENPVIVAVDVSRLDEAESTVRELAPYVGSIKVGLQLFTAHGPDAVRRLASHAPVFLDLKLHDIPNTVREASRNVAALGVSMFTVHALGGAAMIAAAAQGSREGAEEAGVPPPLLAAVTVLSSVSGEELASSASLAFEAKSAGATACVVSGEDVSTVREVVGEAFCLIVPGIRPAGSNGHDQVRILTPSEAIERGADFLVIGRPITSAEDPAGAARSILASVR